MFVTFALRPGSVVAEFELLFRKRLEDEQALAPLKNGIEDGKMGYLDVYPDSLKIIEEVEGNCKCIAKESNNDTPIYCRGHNGK